MMEKISPAQLQEFSLEFFRERHSTYRYLRFGQAFMNKFYPQVACPEVFYEEDTKKAVGEIIDRFIDLGKETLLDIIWKG
jgi:hypothetical protein